MSQQYKQNRMYNQKLNSRRHLSSSSVLSTGNELGSTAHPDTIIKSSAYPYPRSHLTRQFKGPDSQLSPSNYRHHCSASTYYGHHACELQNTKSPPKHDNSNLMYNPQQNVVLPPHLVNQSVCVGPVKTKTKHSKQRNCPNTDEAFGYNSQIIKSSNPHLNSKYKSNQSKLHRESNCQDVAQCCTNQTLKRSVIKSNLEDLVGLSLNDCLQTSAPIVSGVPSDYYTNVTYNRSMRTESHGSHPHYSHYNNHHNHPHQIQYSHHSHSHNHHHHHQQQRHHNQRQPPQHDVHQSQNYSTHRPSRSGRPSVGPNWLGTFGQFQQNCLTSLASMLLCPHTILPIMVGLFNRPNSQIDYMQKLGEELVYLKQTNLYPQNQTKQKTTYWSGLLPPFFTLFIGIILGLAFGWQLGLAVAITTIVFYALFFGVVWFGVRVKQWRRCILLVETLTRYMRGCNLLLNILFYHVPEAPRIAQPIRLLPISVNLKNFNTSTEASIYLAEKMWNVLEQKYGQMAVRLQWASQDKYGDSTKTYRKFCCLPSCVWVFFNFVTIFALIILIVIGQIMDATSPVVVENPPANKMDLAEINTNRNNLRQLTIACALMCGLNFFILIASIVPGCIRLIRGRPFQKPKTRHYWQNVLANLNYDHGNQHEANIFETCINQRSNHSNGCLSNNEHHSIGCCNKNLYNQHGICTAQELTSAANLAAAAATAANVATAAAKAAVSAADYQWKMFASQRSTKKPNYFNNELFSSKDNSSEEIDDDEETEDKEEKMKKEKFDKENKPFHYFDFLHKRRQKLANYQLDLKKSNSSDLNLCNSNEQLLDSKHNSTANPKYKSPRLTKSEGHYYSKEHKFIVELLRQLILQACSVMSMLDSRVQGRQTRLIICVNSWNAQGNSLLDLQKLQDFMQFLNQTLMKTPANGKSYEVPVILAPMDAPEKSMKHISPTIWTPNVVALISTQVTELWNIALSNQTSCQAAPTTPPTAATANDELYKKSKHLSKGLLLNKRSAAHLAEHLHIWYTIHRLCHLPIYFDHKPSGFDIHNGECDFSTSSPTKIGSSHVTQRYFASQEPKITQSQIRTLNDLYVENHELTDINAKRLRHLLTLSAFMGRIIKLDRFNTNRALCTNNQRNMAYMQALNYMSNEPTLITLITWLCFTMHWPFHAAWLSAFIDLDYELLRRNSKRGSKGKHGFMYNKQSSKSEPEGLNRALYESDNQTQGDDETDEDDKCCSYSNAVQPKNKSQSVGLSPKFNFSTLHSRVLKKLAPAIEATRIKALSASFNTFQSHSVDQLELEEFWNTINGTLKICQLAQRDADPFRLGEYLRLKNPAGLVTMSQLIRIMRLTPFMNPQINTWIRDVFLHKTGILEQLSNEKFKRPMKTRMGQSVPTSFSEKDDDPMVSSMPSLHSATNKINHILDKINIEFPYISLNKLTVDEVIKLMKLILMHQHSGSNQTRPHHSVFDHPSELEESETLINDLMPPSGTKNFKHSSSAKDSQLLCQYEMSIRSLNITGSVLNLCPLNELQSKLYMNSADWQLFASVVEALKQQDLVEDAFLDCKTPPNVARQKVSKSHTRKCIATTTINNNNNNNNNNNTNNDRSKNMSNQNQISSSRKTKYCSKHQSNCSYSNQVFGFGQPTKTKMDIKLTKSVSDLTHHVPNSLHHMMSTNQTFHNTMPLVYPNLSLSRANTLPNSVECREQMIRYLRQMKDTQNLKLYQQPINDDNSDDASTSYDQSHPNQSNYDQDLIQFYHAQQQQQQSYLANYCNDSASTSMVSEMNEEVADLSDNHDLSSKQTQGHSHACNCNYWYTRDEYSHRQSQILSSQNADENDNCDVNYESDTYSPDENDNDKKYNFSDNSHVMRMDQINNKRPKNAMAHETADPMCFDSSSGQSYLNTSSLET